MRTASPIVGRAVTRPKSRVHVTTHVEEVVDGVVEHVAGERLDREAGAVAARCPSRAHVAGTDRVEPVGDRAPPPRGSRPQPARVLRGVVVLLGGLVLIPVGEGRIVLAEHQREPTVADAVHVAHVAPVLERRPRAVVRTDANVGPGEYSRARPARSRGSAERRRRGRHSVRRSRTRGSAARAPTSSSSCPA